MSKLFRYSESLGKSNGKKWSQIWTFLFKNGLKSPRRKKTLRIFFHLFTPFKRLFAPTSWSRMFNIFRDSESFGKSNGKKWSQKWKLLLLKGIKSPRWNFFCGFFFFICSLRLNVFLPPLPEVQCPNFLDCQNPWGKVIVRSGLRFEIFCS